MQDILTVGVAGGSGSGKTRVLVQRFLYILGLGLRQPAETCRFEKRNCAR